MVLESGSDEPHGQRIRLAAHPDSGRLSVEDARRIRVHTFMRFMLAYKPGQLELLDEACGSQA